MIIGRAVTGLNVR